VTEVEGSKDKRYTNFIDHDLQRSAIMADGESRRAGKCGNEILWAQNPEHVDRHHILDTDVVNAVAEGTG